jgi:hypothetical protein
MIYQAFTAGQVAAIVLSAMLSGSLRADPNKLNGAWALFAPSLIWIQNRAWIFLLLLGAFLAASEIARKVVGPPWVWDAVHYYLDVFQEYAFPEQAGDMLHDHRVTLFKYVRWRWCLRRWPWSGWLVPLERSGHTTQRTNIAFRAPDDASQAEGVAGATWASKWAVPVSDLPDLSENSSAQDIQSYAEKTFVSAEFLGKYMRRGRPLARSFLGIPVEVKSKRWGVVVMDSKREMHVAPRYLSLYTIIARFLSRLLERA